VDELPRTLALAHSYGRICLTNTSEIGTASEAMVGVSVSGNLYDQSESLHLTEPMLSNCEVKGCKCGMELFCPGCLKHFCERHGREHEEALRELRAKCLFPAGETDVT